MTTEKKTKEDLQQDAVNIVYGFFTVIKWGFYIAIFFILFFLFSMTSPRQII